MCSIFTDFWFFFSAYTTEDLKNVTSSLFSIMAIVLGCLTYLQARKSFFAPKKTEVYKLQIEELREAYKLFETTSENLIQRANIYHIGMATTCSLIIEHTIHNIIDRPHNVAGENEENFKFAINKLKNFLDNKYSTEIIPEGASEVGKSEIANFSESFLESCGSSPELAWQAFFIKKLRINDKHVKYMNSVKKVECSALMTKKIKDEVGSFNSIMGSLYLDILKKVNEKKNAIEVKFTKLDEFNSMTVAEFGRDSMDGLDVSELEKSAEKIISMINDELKTNELWQ